jgi:hypothetical protein
MKFKLRNVGDRDICPKSKARHPGKRIAETFIRDQLNWTLALSCDVIQLHRSRINNPLDYFPG